MLDYEEITNTIEELENGETTYDSCIKLASLYIVEEHIKSRLNSIVDSSTSVSNSSVIDELNDILPQYRLYCEVKRKYALNELTSEAVIMSMRDVCGEIYEFLHILYSNTDMQAEREEIKKLIAKLGDVC